MSESQIASSQWNVAPDNQRRTESDVKSSSSQLDIWSGPADDDPDSGAFRTRHNVEVPKLLLITHLHLNREPQKPDLIKSEMSETEEMRVDPTRAQALISQLSSVKERIGAVANGRNVSRRINRTYTPLTSFMSLWISIINYPSTTFSLAT